MASRLRVTAALSGVVFAVLLTGCGNDGGGAVQVSPGATTPPGEPAQATSDPSGLGAGGSGSGGASEPATVIDPNGNGTSGDQRTVAVGDTFQVPDLVGMDLQAAQDLLQGRNSYKVEQSDALGKGRQQLVDSDWRVCRQSPAAGRYVSIKTVVRLASVRDGEKCP